MPAGHIFIWCWDMVGDWSYQGRSIHWIIGALDVSWTYIGRILSPMTRYALALGSHFCQTLSTAVVCPSLDISTEPTPDRIITELSRPALRVHLTTGDGGLVVQGNLAQNRGGWPVTYESWTGDCEATRSGPIGLAETRGNGYVFSDTLLKMRWACQ